MGQKTISKFRRKLNLTNPKLFVDIPFVFCYLVKKSRRLVMAINRVRDEEKLSKDKLVYVRLPMAIMDRLIHQKKRLAIGHNAILRMALIKFLEEEEAKERLSSVEGKGGKA